MRLTWNGRTDRFDWKLIGKQEMLIPYNGNKLLQPKPMRRCWARLI
jgi:hypothetical protein